MGLRLPTDNLVQHYRLLWSMDGELHTTHPAAAYSQNLSSHSDEDFSN